MFPFTPLGPIDRAELKALLFASLFCCLFITFLLVAHPPRVTTTVSNYVIPPHTKFPEPSKPPVMDPLERYRVVPEDFKQIDFENYSYGLYTISKGKRIDLTLFVGELELPDNSGWFSLKDVFYRDVTGDRRPEAIVWLSHVQCGGSCDGGADLFYVFTMRNGKPKSIWQYETGSTAYGCGLKSFTIAGRQIVLELFGRCPKQAMEDPGSSKFLVEDLTFILLEFDGQRYAQQSIEFFDTSPTDVKNYEPAIHIF